MPRRILVLGATGVDKEQAIERNLKAFLKDDQLTPPQWALVDFEKDYVSEETGSEFHYYLDATGAFQRRLWRSAWQSFQRKLDSDLGGDDVVLMLHGVLTRSVYGIRSPVRLFDVVQGFAPTDVVTLIDDVYSSWYRTELRAGGLTESGEPSQGFGFKGRPTLEQLLSARRAEQLVGDIISWNLDVPSPPRNEVIAVRHPARTLARIVFGDKTRLVYLSFPISGPRRREEKGDPSGIAEVNEFLRKACEFEKANKMLAFLCPLTIDELPLKQLLTGNALGKTVLFSMASRWDMREFYGQEEVLLCDDKSLPGHIHLNRSEVEDAMPLIEADLRMRDYRLVVQSSRLAAYNPCFDGEITKGVRNEISYALDHRIPVHIFQDPRHDPEKEVEQKWKPPAGSLGDQPGSEYIHLHGSVEELLEALLN